MKYRIALLLTLTVAAAAALTMAGGGAARKNATVQKMTVLMYDFRFKLSKATLAPGKVTLTVKNRGHSIHNFLIPGLKSSPFLAPGTQKTYTVTVKKGKFHYLCSVPRHEQLGMFGELVVK